jgi:hypothetical protein
MERTSKVCNAIDRLDSPVAINFCRAVYDGFVIYEVAPGQQASAGMVRKCYKRSYTMDAAGAVVLGNDMEEVVEKREYVSAVAANEEKGAKDCGCNKPAGNTTTTEGEEEMAKNTAERKAKVDVLLAANAGFTETDRTMLEGLECGQFAALQALAARPVTIPTPAPIGNEADLLAAGHNVRVRSLDLQSSAVFTVLDPPGI